MASPDRSKMAAGLSALLGTPAETTPKPEAATYTPPKKRTSGTGKAAGAKVHAGSASKKAAAKHPSPTPPDEGEGVSHARTSTGYLRESGEQVFRVSLFLTKAERRALRELAEDAEMSLTDYVKGRVGL